MLAKVHCSAVQGIVAHPVEVEVNDGSGETLTVIVGLPDAAVRESRDRVTTALGNSGFKIPLGRTTINLAPADIRKEGPNFDLSIAVGMLAASEQMESKKLDHLMMIGELALTGAVRPVKGVLPIAIQARAMGLEGMIVPTDNATEAAVVDGLNIYPIANLREAAAFLEGREEIEPKRIDIADLFAVQDADGPDFADVKGQEKRFKGNVRITCNARMQAREIKQHCQLDEEPKNLLRMTMSELNLSARAYDRILKVSRTIADLADSGEITSEHLSETLQYRTLDRQLWG